MTKVSEDIVLKAKKRDGFGRKVKALRVNGDTPAVVHDHGKESIHVAVVELELKKAFRSAGKSQPIKLDVDGKKYTTLIKEVTYKPGTTKTLHSVFQAVSADEKVTAEVPVRVVGEIPAERASLLVLKHLDTVRVEALPKDLIDVIEVSGEKLAEVGDKLHVSDLTPPAGVTIKAEHEQTIATVEMPKDQIAEADAALEEMKEQEGAEPEIEGEGEEEAVEESKEESEEKDGDKPGSKEEE